MRALNSRPEYKTDKDTASTLFVSNHTVAPFKMGFEKPKQNRLRNNTSSLKRNARHSKKNITFRQSHWGRLLHKQYALWVAKYGMPRSKILRPRNAVGFPKRVNPRWSGAARTALNSRILFRRLSWRTLRTAHTYLRPHIFRVLSAYRPARTTAPYLVVQRVPSQITLWRSDFSKKALLPWHRGVARPRRLAPTKKLRELIFFRSSLPRAKTARRMSVSQKVAAKSVYGKRTGLRRRAALGFGPSAFSRTQLTTRFYIRSRHKSVHARKSAALRACPRLLVLSRSCFSLARNAGALRSLLRKSTSEQLVSRARAQYSSTLYYKRNQRLLRRRLTHFTQLLAEAKKRRYKARPLRRFIRRFKWRSHKTRALKARRKWKRWKRAKLFSRLKHRMWVTRRIAKPLCFTPGTPAWRQRRREVQDRRNIRFIWWRDAWKKRHAANERLRNTPIKTTRNPKWAKLSVSRRELLVSCAVQRYQGCVFTTKRRRRFQRALFAAHSRGRLTWLPKYSCYQRTYLRLITRPNRLLHSTRRRYVYRSRRALSTACTVFQSRLRAIGQLAPSQPIYRLPMIGTARNKSNDIQPAPALLPHFFYKSRASTPSYANSALRAVRYARRYRIMPERNSKKVLPTRSSPRLRSPKK